MLSTSRIFFEVRARLGGAIEFEQHRRQRLARLGVVRAQRRPKLGRLERLAVLLGIDCGQRGALGHARVARLLGDAPERERGNVDLAAMAGNFAKQDVVEDVAVEHNLGQGLGDRLRWRYRRARRRQAGAGGQPRKQRHGGGGAKVGRIHDLHAPGSDAAWRARRLKETLNKSVPDFSEHEKQKTWFLLFFISQTLPYLRNGGASCTAGNLWLNRRFPALTGNRPRNFRLADKTAVSASPRYPLEPASRRRVPVPTEIIVQTPSPPRAGELGRRVLLWYAPATLRHCYIVQLDSVPR